MNKLKNIALVAHDGKKDELIAWAKQHEPELSRHHFYATGSTGTLLEQNLGWQVHKLESGPLGGDQQLGALIVEGRIDILIFYWDPLEAQPHDPDVRALLRIAVVWNIPIACNQITADMLLLSPLFTGEVKRIIPDYSHYRQRLLR